MISRLAVAIAALCAAAGCVPEVGVIDDSHDSGADAQPDSPLDAGADSAPDADANADAAPARPPFSALIAAEGGPNAKVPSSAPFEKHTVTITRSSATSKIYLASTADGLGQMFIDDYIHLIVVPSVGRNADEFFGFWPRWNCAGASTNPPPGADSGASPPVDVTPLFSTDTATSQTVTLEFWHCAEDHAPTNHKSVYLVEK